MNSTQGDFEQNSNNPGNFLAGVLLGGLAGAGAMLLLAPQSGKRTRTQLRLAGLELRDQTTEAVEEGVTHTRRSARHLGTNLRDKAKELQQNGQDMLAQQGARVAAVVAAGKSVPSDE